MNPGNRGATCFLFLLLVTTLLAESPETAAADEDVAIENDSPEDNDSGSENKKEVRPFSPSIELEEDTAVAFPVDI